MVWPALFLAGRLIAIPVIVAGLVIEYFFLRHLTDLGRGKLIVVDLTMNFASSLLGLFLIPIAGLIWEIGPHQLLYALDPTRFGTFSTLGWAASFCMAVLINAVIESLVVSNGFKQKLGKFGFAMLCLANSMTVAIAVVSFRFFPIET